MTHSRKVVPFRARHVRLIKPREDLGPFDVRTYASYYERHGTAYSALVDDEYIAAGGLLPLWNGVSNAWATIGERANLHILWVIHTIRGFLGDLMLINGLWRIHAIVAVGNGPARRLARALGLTEGPLLRYYGPDGKDYKMYERILK